MFPPLNLPTYPFRLKNENGKTLIFDEVRKKYLVLTPEEWVRQHVVKHLATNLGYPTALMKIETGLRVNQRTFRADLVQYNRAGGPLLVAEFKAPEVPITQDVFDQIARYNMKFGVPYLLVSNGLLHYFCKIDFDNQNYSFLADIPAFFDL